MTIPNYARRGRGGCGDAVVIGASGIGLPGKTQHVATLWECLAPLGLQLASSYAAAAGEPLYYCYAADAHTKGEALTRDERNCLLRNANLNNTGSRLGILPLFVGMEVEVTDKLSQEAGLMKAARGTVISVTPDPREPTDAPPPCIPGPPGSRALRYLPIVEVRVPGYTEGAQEGARDVVIVRATRSHSFEWKWNTVRGRTTHCTRLQLPLALSELCTAYTAQGMTAEWLLAHLDKPNPGATWHDLYYQVYVAIGRPRNVQRFGHHGPVLPELRRVCSLGPEPHVLAELARWEDRYEKTKPKLRRMFAEAGVPLPAELQGGEPPAATAAGDAAAPQARIRICDRALYHAGF